MVKDKNTVIEEFNDLVNMTPTELRAWLKEDQSQSSGWKGASGETVGHERYSHFILILAHVPMRLHYPSAPHRNRKKTDLNSGRKIANILDHNPSKDPSGYSDEDLEHMRRVVAYCKRHLAQEGHAKRDTASRSYRSLKNWGHDSLKE